MHIPFANPYIDQQVIDEVLDTLKSNWINTGPKVLALEDAIKKLSGTSACICVNSWTSGAIITLKWFGIGQGDEIIVPAYTYSATALCVLHCGATPVIVDINDDLTIDPEKVCKAITKKTKAILCVDIAGWPCNYEKLRKIADHPNSKTLFTPSNEKQERLGRILLVADAAHSLGALYGGKPAAQQADITIYSFNTLKNITTAEGGCICLNLPESFNTDTEYRLLKLYSLNGQTKTAYEKLKLHQWKYDIVLPGFKSNMPDICAALGLAQLRAYEQHLLPARRRIAFCYHEAFNRYTWYQAPKLANETGESAYHFFPLRINNINEQDRDIILESLIRKGIGVNVHFIPMPMLTLFKNLGYQIADYPNAYLQYSREISLPIYPQLRDIEIKYVIDSTKEVVERHVFRSL